MGKFDGRSEISRQSFTGTDQTKQVLPEGVTWNSLKEKYTEVSMHVIGTSPNNPNTFVSPRIQLDPKDLVLINESGSFNFRLFDGVIVSQINVEDLDSGEGRYLTGGTAPLTNATIIVGGIQ